ncbi:chloride channel CLIC-like protein 1 isoform X2 [Kryptolebias marmoratus]|uniref:chloride channel CLIC-like protein 1 isoform X2 n=1 Tax=Kryptolebias marmoratus TaxID=37003 RepID=UPI0007F87384|nr:chloride channel CLIC-like protein 1 isoform X2 [Kryptolebias marmoratus]
MLPAVLLCCFLLSAVGQQMDDDWLDPYDMLNYDPSTKTMRKTPEPSTFTNVVTKRREYIQDSNQAQSCNQQVADLQKQIEDQKKIITNILQQPTCNPVFKRFLSRLLKEIQRIGELSDSKDVFYDAKVKLSREGMAEIQSLLKDEDRWGTGALDNALSQILVDFKPHDYEAWKWRFEDTFGVELDTVLKIGIFILILSAIICTQLWSTVSWFAQFRRMMVVCFFVSIAWNWLYLYQAAFAEHQKKIVKMENFNDKCTGVKKIDWSDSLKEWYRTTWTLQDDPCEEYYKVLLINPLLLVPPNKAISVTITTYFTDPLKHVGQGISEFLRALLKDLPITLQIPVLITIMLLILVVVYGSVQAAFQYGIMAPLRRPRRDPPPPELEQPPRPALRNEGRDNLAGGDGPVPALAPAPAPAQQHVPRQRDDNARLDRNDVHQRRPNRSREKPAPINVETLGNADHQYSGDENDGRHESHPEAEDNSSAESGSEDQQETQDEGRGASAAANTAQPKNKQTESDSSQRKNKPLKEKQKRSEDEPRDGAAARPQPAEQQPSQIKVQGPDVSAEEETTSASQRHVETVGVPVQETNPAAGD